MSFTREKIPLTKQFLSLEKKKSSLSKEFFLLKMFFSLNRYLSVTFAAIYIATNCNVCIQLFILCYLFFILHAWHPILCVETMKFELLRSVHGAFVLKTHDHDKLILSRNELYPSEIGGHVLIKFIWCIPVLLLGELCSLRLDQSVGDKGNYQLVVMSLNDNREMTIEIPVE